ncbi:MAG: hypothetical protein HYY13_00520, partial [Nitrospirae bacterium]|nr:hypothetical protein [Nitrospirota bacterium]
TTGTCSGGGCTTTPAGATSEFWTGIYYCNDGINNDCDGMTDCSDPDCAGASNCSGGSCPTYVTQATCPTSTCCWETSTNTCKTTGTCSGGGCTTTPAGATSEFWTGIYYCNDGINNDCDGMTDCSDPDCAGASNCSGGSCSTFVTQPTCPTSTCCWDNATYQCKGSGQCGGGGCNYNMICEGGESYPGCSDCPYMPPPPSCNYNTVCDAGEDNYNCPGDCPPGTSGGPPPGGGYELCYDAIDNDGDGMMNCADPDCGFDPACATSGGCNFNAVCEASENAFSCPDCAGGAIGCNMNGMCDGGESSYSCPSDCAAGGMGKAPYTCSFSYSCDDSAGACYAAAGPAGPGGGGSCATPPPGVTCTKEAAKKITVCKDRIACTPAAAPPPPAGPGGMIPPPPGATCATDACQTCSSVTRTVYECTDCLAGGFAPGAPAPPPPAPGAKPAERRQAAGPAGQYCVTYQWQPPATDILSNCTLSGSTYVCKRCMSDPWTPIGGFANVSEEVVYADGSSQKVKTFLFEGKRLVSRAFKVDEIAALIAAAKKGDTTTLESLNFLKSDALATTVVSVEVSTLTAAANKAARRQEASTTAATPTLASASITGETTVSIFSETNLAAARGVSKKETSSADFTLLAYSDGQKGFEVRSFAGKADLPCPLGAGGANVNTNEKFAGTFLEQFPGAGSTSGTFEYCAVDKAGDPNSDTDDSGAWYHRESGTSTYPELAGAQSEYAVKETQTNVMQGIWTNDLASTDTILRDCGENVTGREEVVTTFKNPSSGTLSDEKESGEFATDAKTCNVLPKAVEGSIFASVQNLKMEGSGGKASGEIPLPGGKIKFEITGADSNSPHVKFETTFDAFGISMSAKADIRIHPPDAKGNTGEGTLDVKAGDETLKVDLAMDKKGWNTVVGSTTDADGNTLAFKQTRTDAGSTLDMTLTYPDGKQDTGTVAFTKEPNSAKEVGSGTLNAAKPDGTKEDLAMVFCSNGQVAIYDQEGEKRGGLLSGPETCK